MYGAATECRPTSINYIYHQLQARNTSKPSNSEVTIGRQKNKKLRRNSIVYRPSGGGPPWSCCRMAVSCSESMATSAATANIFSASTTAAFRRWRWKASSCDVTSCLIVCLVVRRIFISLLVIPVFQMKSRLHDILHWWYPQHLMPARRGGILSSTDSDRPSSCLSLTVLSVSGGGPAVPVQLENTDNRRWNLGFQKLSFTVVNARQFLSCFSTK